MTTETKTVTVAEELRQAAAHLRETGAEATAGRWASGDLEEQSDFTRRIAITADGDTIAEIHLSMEAAAWHFMCNGAKNDAAWIVLAQPALAEPLASWLEATAAVIDRHLPVWTAAREERPALERRQPLDELMEHHFGPALAVARSLLGSTR